MSVAGPPPAPSNPSINSGNNSPHRGDLLTHIWPLMLIYIQKQNLEVTMFGNVQLYCLLSLGEEVRW